MQNQDNRCKRCDRKPGKYRAIDDGKPIGVYLLNESNGGKICNLCLSTGQFIRKRKIGKKEKKLLKRMMNQSRETLKKIHSL